MHTVTLFRPIKPKLAGCTSENRASLTPMATHLVDTFAGQVEPSRQCLQHQCFHINSTLTRPQASGSENKNQKDHTSNIVIGTVQTHRSGEHPFQIIQPRAEQH